MALALRCKLRLMLSSSFLNAFLSILRFIVALPPSPTLGTDPARIKTLVPGSVLGRMLAGLERWGWQGVNPCPTSECKGQQERDFCPAPTSLQLRFPRLRSGSKRGSATGSTTGSPSRKPHGISVPQRTPRKKSGAGGAERVGAGPVGGAVFTVLGAHFGGEKGGRKNKQPQKPQKPQKP
jgi:hypothetical protein